MCAKKIPSKQGVKIKSIFESIKARWAAPQGYRDILILAIPLIFSTASWSIQQFVDRMFLSWYSQDALAAAMPAGILNFSLLCVFIGTAGYTSTFVSQYVGAGQSEKIGSVIMHSFYISLVGAAVVMVAIPFSDSIFAFTGHASAVAHLESTYFKILCFGGLGPILSAALSGYFSGQGRNWPVMWINFITTFINLILDYFMIFGIGPFPEMGIAGAGWATVIAGYCSLGMYLYLIFLPGKNKRGIAIDWSSLYNHEFMMRFLKYGLPSGVHFFLEVIGFTIFLLLLGRIGTSELAATNIAFNVNSIAFMPIIGLGIAVSIIVGQSIGEGKPDRAAFATASAAQLSIVYMSLCSAIYLLFPTFFIAMFHSGDETYVKTAEYAIVLLRFVALYGILDGINIVYASAIKGAGDTRFVMINGVILSASVLVIPAWIAIEHYHKGLIFSWMICTAYIMLLGVIHFARFQQGKWRTMSVIDHPCTAISSQQSRDPAGMI